MAFKATKGQGTFRIEVEPYALKNLISTLNLLDKETQGRVRDAAQPLSKRLAGQLMMFGGSSPTPQTKLVLESMLTPRDRLIRVDLGGSKKVGRPYGGTASKSGKGNKVGRSAAPAGALLWGSEYGSHSGVDRAQRKYTNRFKAPQNREGYWINKGVDFYTPVVAREYIEIVQGIINDLRLN
jgi:hypothetical protein